MAVTIALVTRYMFKPLFIELKLSLSYVIEVLSCTDF
jgi:hypothetical protein